MNPEITISISRDDDGLFLEALINSSDLRIKAAAESAAAEYFFLADSQKTGFPRFYFPIEETQTSTDAEYAHSFALAHHAAYGCATQTLLHFKKFLNFKGITKFSGKELLSKGKGPKESDMWADIIKLFPSLEDNTTPEASAAWKAGVAISQP